MSLFLSSDEVYFLQREEVGSVYSMGDASSPEPVDMLPDFF